MKIPFEWEELDDREGRQVYRAKVIGGWIIHSLNYDDIACKEYNLGQCESMVFVPDPNHEWEI